MQIARDVLSLKEADSEEFRPDTKHPVIIHMPEGMFYEQFLPLLLSKHLFTNPLYPDTPYSLKPHILTRNDNNRLLF
jgi:hypothetical protein